MGTKARFTRRACLSHRKPTAALNDGVTFQSNHLNVERADPYFGHSLTPTQGAKLT
jgi:hypothetical protein